MVSCAIWNADKVKLRDAENKTCAMTIGIQNVMTTLTYKL